MSLKRENPKIRKMDFEYRPGCMSDYSYVENYLIHNGYEKVVTELQILKPLIVFDYLKTNGYKDVANNFAKAAIEKKAKQVQEPRQFDEEDLNRLVPIRDLISDKVIRLEELEREFPGTELVKLAKFILDDNVSVKNSIALTISVRNNGHSEKRFPFLKTTKLSGKSYGNNSEESMLLKNWRKLVKKVPILAPKDFLIDIQKTTKTSHVWIQKLLGAYLSQKCVNHRVVNQFFTSLIALKMRKGSLNDEEKEKLLEFDEKHNGKPTINEWKELALEMGRSSAIIQSALKRLKEEKYVNQALKYTDYSLEDEEKILRHVDEHCGLVDPKRLKKLSAKDFSPLVQVLERNSKAIYSHFHSFLLPIMLGSIYDSKDFKYKWKDDFLKYIIKEKVETISDVNWDHVLKEKPFLTKKQISTVLSNAMKRVKKPMKRSKTHEKGPLYVQIDFFRARIPKNRKQRRRRSCEERKMKTSQIYDEMVKAKSQ